MKIILINIISLGLLFITREVAYCQNMVLPFIPAPQSVQLNSGTFHLSEITLVYYSINDSGAAAESKPLLDYIFQNTGFLLKTTLVQPKFNENSIWLSSQYQNPNGNEAYTLNIDPNQIQILSSGTSGLFYGITSLEQLFPNGGLLLTGSTQTHPILLPCLRVEDYPKYAWRGMHLDVSRHFFSINFVKRYLDYLAWCKMNVFHWHLTDSQGWRLEIKKYPKLTSIGAFRGNRPNELFAGSLPDSLGEVPNYGGYYTQEEVKEVVRYASQRHISIIPEIDMPGHSQAALVAYPQYSTLPGPQFMPTGSKGAYENSFNPGYDSTYIFLENILSEVMNLFPSKYIHIGGDEVDRTAWKTNFRCIELIKREHLRSEDELQAYFTKKIEVFVFSKGHKMIGWDEIMEGGIAPRATVESWRGVKGGLKAVKEGHEVIMSPNTFAYFDLYQGDPKQEPNAYSKLNLTTAYGFSPDLPELNSEEKKRILGGEGTLWTETINDPLHVEYMLFPRLFALSESLWLDPQNKNWESFLNRLPVYEAILKNAKTNFATSAYNVNNTPIRDSGYLKIKMSLANELNEGKIYYTEDGTNPSPNATLYTQPFEIQGKKQIKMAAFRNGLQISGVNDEIIETSWSTSQIVSMTPGPSKRFPVLSGFSLTDGIRGTGNPFDGRWVGFYGSKWEAVLDLGKPHIIKNFGIDFFINSSIGIYLPKGLMAETSLNGKNYTPLVSYSEGELKALKTETRLKIYREFNPQSTRYLRIKALIPPPGPYDKGHAYILTDEITVN